MSRLYPISAAILGAFFLLSAVISPVAASTFVGGSNGWTVIGAPTQPVTSGNPELSVTYKNNLNATTLGIVLLVVHNSIGQTILITSATLDIAPGGNSTAYEVLFGLPSGTFSGMLFVILPSGAALSAETTVSITLNA